MRDVARRRHHDDGGRVAGVVRVRREPLERVADAQREDVLEYSEKYVRDQLDNAILSGDCDRMATLVARGAPANYETAHGFTALLKCVQLVKREGE